MAKGSEHTAKMPADPRVGAEENITEPKTSICGTARTNCCGSHCLPAARQDGLQPDKTNTLRPKLEAMKAPPIKQRVKSQMSTSESACQVIDNGPVHMLSTVAWRVVEGHEVRGE